MSLTRLSTSAITTSEISTLNHKVLNTPMESRSLISKTLLLSSRQNTEVLSGLWDSLSVETHNNATQWLVAMLNVEVDLVGDLWALAGGLGGIGEEEEGGSQDQEEGDNEALEVKHLDSCN